MRIRILIINTAPRDAATESSGEPHRLLLPRQLIFSPPAVLTPSPAPEGQLMLSLEDPRWQQLQGGYRVPYDPSVPLRRMEAGANVWGELWQELHHQGDLGEASYAAVPHIVRIGAAQGSRDWNLYALAATIEIERHRASNPAIPAWAESDYHQAWSELLKLALADLATDCESLTLRSALSVLALGRGELKLGALLNYVDTDEISEYLQEHLDWSELYGETR